MYINAEKLPVNSDKHNPTGVNYERDQTEIKGD